MSDTGCWAGRSRLITCLTMVPKTSPPNRVKRAQTAGIFPLKPQRKKAIIKPQRISIFGLAKKAVNTIRVWTKPVVLLEVKRAWQTVSTVVISIEFL